MKYPEYEFYRNLYARYLSKGVNYLLEHLEPLNDCYFLDLCGGDGRLAKGALSRGARRALVVDESQEMLSGVNPDQSLSVLHCDVENFFRRTTDTFDRVGCQQAINYWFSESAIHDLAQVIQKDGIFVFNTFNQKPPNGYVRKKYLFDGKVFLESHCMLGERIFHTQICSSTGEAHSTDFRWIPPEEYLDTLSPFFEVQVSTSGPSSIYQCKRHGKGEKK